MSQQRIGVMCLPAAYPMFGGSGHDRPVRSQWLNTVHFNNEEQEECTELQRSVICYVFYWGNLISSLDLLIATSYLKFRLTIFGYHL